LNKDIIKKLGVLKAYSSLLIPGIIVLIAAGVLFASSMMGRGFEKTVERGSISTGRSISNQIGSVVSKEQWKVEEQYQQEHITDANQIAEMFKQTTQRELLNYKMFPEPGEESRLIFRDFGNVFRNSIEKLVSEANGLECPSTQELNQTLKQSLGSDRGTGTNVPMMMLPPEMFGPQVHRGVREDSFEQRVRDALCTQRAQSANVYANPSDLALYRYWDQGDGSEDTRGTRGTKSEQFSYESVNQAVKECWFTQVGYWVIEDVFKTVNSMNSDFENVLSAPVKRIMNVSFSGMEFTGNQKEKQSLPRYVKSITDGMIVPCTGRASDKDIDVVQFSLLAVVDARYVMDFMKELCSGKDHTFRGYDGKATPKTFKHNQITVLNYRLDPVDRMGISHELYRYGEAPVKQLELICEYVFVKEGYEQVKPESVKTSAQSGSAVSGSIGNVDGR